MEVGVGQSQLSAAGLVPQLPDPGSGSLFSTHLSDGMTSLLSADPCCLVASRTLSRAWGAGSPAQSHRLLLPPGGSLGVKESEGRPFRSLISNDPKVKGIHRMFRKKYFEFSESIPKE